jgi:DNA-binding CsgD family transcriptional regulator
MPTSQIPHGSLAALNDNELQILRLLANGHTAKSIAASLGRSETAINERLREARRKTGVGSSRELARLLDAQKIWDRNIDLSAQPPFEEVPDQPRSPGFEWTKGRIVMFALLPVAAIGLALAASNAGTTSNVAAEGQAAPAPAPATTSPLMGRWALDVSRIPEAERPQSVTIDFRISSDGQWTTHVEITAPDGSMRYADSTARGDGVAVPVSGTMGAIDTVSLRQPEANTLVMTLGKDGAPFSTRVYTVADDGRTMTETIIWPGSEIPELETTYFNRVG